MPAFAGEAGEEAFVVADEKQCAGGGRQGVLQAQEAGEVEVVRRFVHHDEVGTAGDAEGEEEFADFAGGGLGGFEEAAGTRAEPGVAAHDVAEDRFGQALGVGQDAHGFGGGDFLRDVDEVLGRHVEVRKDGAQEGGLSGAVGAGQGDALGGRDVEGRVGEAASGREGQLARGDAEEGVAAGYVGVVEPEAGRVFLAHGDGGPGRLGLGGAAG